METTRILFIGGFIGAGKTALLLEAAQRLMKQGLRVGAITNGFVSESVDTALLTRNGLDVTEVNGSCFGSNFNGLTEAIGRLRADTAADVILAEPAGAGVDLSATVIQPLKQLYARKLSPGPLSVLADPVRLDDILNGGTSGLHPDVACIFQKQLEESDIILITKTDTVTPEASQQLAARTRAAYHSCVMRISSANGDGVDGWLQEAMMRYECGLRIAAVDYDACARGYAVMTRLSGTVRVCGKASDWDRFVRRLLAALRKRFEEQACPVEHIKIFVENGDAYIAGSLTHTSGTLSFRGSAGTGDHMKLVINAQAETAPDTLDQIIRDTLDECTHHSYKTETDTWTCLQPECSAPTYRMDKIVKMPVSLKGLKVVR
jgi:Ni2+-binding GTPase involved in maturation of urease and hydrogenase